MSKQRHCGDCTMCCRLLPVRELQKPANTRCDHQGRKGCAIYRQLGFPASCAFWNCAWLAGEDLPRPDRCGWVVDIMPDEIHVSDNDTGAGQRLRVVQVWVEPGRDVTGDPRLRRFAERCAERRVPLLLRFGSTESVAVFAPAMSSDGKWHFVGGDRMKLAESLSGNLLVDRLKKENAHA